MTSPYRSLLLLFLVVLLFVVSGLAYAQDEEAPPPEFLYRDENNLILVNGYTGERVELLNNLSEQDRFIWSLDGQYLLALQQDGNSYRYCLNVFEVDTRQWQYSEAIACGVESALF